MKKTYKVKLKLHRVDGGIPTDPNVIQAWLSANSLQDDAELAERIASKLVTEDELETRLSKLTTTFMQDSEGRPCLESRVFKATLINAANTMGLFGMIPGLNELIRRGSEIRPELIPLAQDTNSIKTQTKIVNVTTPQGKPVAGFKRVRYLENVTCEFDFITTDRMAIAQSFGTKKDGKAAVPRKNAIITKELLEVIINYAGTFIGFGANRSQGVGKAELLSLEEIA